MTAGLVAFLRERLDEDEQTAQAATAGPWTVDGEAYPETIYSGSTAVVAGGRWGGEASVFESTEDAIHIARHDPARVLAEVAAKRRIMARHRPLTSQDDLVKPQWYGSCDGCGPGPNDERVAPTMDECPELRDLALPYAGHRDYRPEWAPAS